MKENNILKIKDVNGKEYTYKILAAFKWNITDKYYIVYTDNTKNDDGSLNITATTYNPDNLHELFPIETDEEWNYIEKMIEKTIGDDKNGL